MEYNTLITLMGIIVVVNSYTGILYVPNVNGKCQIKGKLVDSGETYYEEENCEAWVCNANSHALSYKHFQMGTTKFKHEEKATVSLLGCGVLVNITEDGIICRAKSTKGRYPECCNGSMECS